MNRALAEKELRQARAMGAEVDDLPPETEEEEAEQMAAEHARISEHLRKHG